METCTWHEVRCSKGRCWYWTGEKTGPNPRHLVTTASTDLDLTLHQTTLRSKFSWRRLQGSRGHKTVSRMSSSISAGVRYSTEPSKSTGQLHFTRAVGRVVGNHD